MHFFVVGAILISNWNIDFSFISCWKIDHLAAVNLNPTHLIENWIFLKIVFETNKQKPLGTVVFYYSWLFGWMNEKISKKTSLPLENNVLLLIIIRLMAKNICCVFQSQGVIKLNMQKYTLMIKIIFCYQKLVNKYDATCIEIAWKNKNDLKYFHFYSSLKM